MIKQNRNEKDLQRKLPLLAVAFRLGLLYKLESSQLWSSFAQSVLLCPLLPLEGFFLYHKCFTFMPCLKIKPFKLIIISEGN